MTKAERRRCFQYAKSRVLAQIKEELRHQVAMGTVADDRRDLTNRVQWDIEHFQREVRRIKFEDWVKI